ncbi:hypothetical protein D3C72_1408540 [compost metagenome]
MAAGVTEHFNHQVGGAVGDGALAVEVGRAGHKDAQAHHARHAVQAVAGGGGNLRQQSQRGQAGRFNAVGIGNLVAQLAQVLRFAALARDLPRDGEQVAFQHKRHIVGGGRGGRFQGVAQFADAAGNCLGHCGSPVNK